MANEGNNSKHSRTEPTNAQIELVLANRICNAYPRWDVTRARKVAEAFCKAVREDVTQFKFTYVQHAAHAVKSKGVEELIALKPKALGQIVDFATSGHLESTEPYRD